MANPQPERGTTRFAHELLEAMMRYPFAGRELRIVLKVARETYGWSRKEAKLSYGEISRSCQITRRNAILICQDLVRKKILIFREDDQPRKAGFFSINKNYDNWRMNSSVDNPVDKMLTSALNSVVDDTNLVSLSTLDIVSQTTLADSVMGDTTSKQYIKQLKKPEREGDRPEDQKTKVRKLLIGWEDKIGNGSTQELVERFVGAGFDLVRVWGAIVQARGKDNPAGYLVHALGSPRYSVADGAIQAAKLEARKHGYLV